jgi:Domain of unknown function (DUF4388)
MTLAGYLAEYSLAEIFNFVHEGSRTGVLEIFPDPNVIPAPTDPRFVWFEDGRVIAATSGLDGKGLLMAIGQRKFIPPAQIELIDAQMHQLPQPLGIYLKSRGLLDAEQLKLLFNAQTIVAVCKLFEPKNRQFHFNPTRAPLNSELTGIGLPAQEVGMLGLRVLKDWSGLSSKLPEPDYVIQKWSAQQPSFRLDRHELQLWKLADGQTTLATIAEQMGMSVDVIRQVSFRLSSFRLIQEIPNDSIPPISEELAVSVSGSGFKNSSVSSSFLGNLKNFLKKGNNKSVKSLIK